jgi:hypothetical protein
MEFCVFILRVDLPLLGLASQFFDFVGEGVVDGLEVVDGFVEEKAV